MPTRAQLEAATSIVERERSELRGRLAIDYVVPDYYARRPKPCMGGWGRAVLNVDPKGRVLPCHAAASIPSLDFASVRDLPLRDIWEESPAFQAFRGTDWMPEPCRSCPLKEQDFGGCRCQAMALTGDPRNADPVCVHSPARALVAAAVAEAEASDAPFAYRRHAPERAGRPGVAEPLSASLARAAPSSG